MTTVIRAEPPIRRDWNMKRGADFHRVIKLKESDGVTAKNTTGYTMTMTIKAAANGETFATYAIGSGITHSPASGQFNIDVTAATIDPYDFSSAIYEIVITDSGGGKTIPFMGAITLT